jgi:hypothetical protein
VSAPPAPACPGPFGIWPTSDDEDQVAGSTHALMCWWIECGYSEDGTRLGNLKTTFSEDGLEQTLAFFNSGPSDPQTPRSPLELSIST